MAKTESELLETYRLYQQLKEAEYKQKERIESVFLPEDPSAIPFPEQEAFFRDTAHQILLRCGNRAAKTFSNIRNLAWILMRNHPYQTRYNCKTLGIDYEDTKAMNIWVIGPTFDFCMNTILKKYLFQMVPKWYYTDDKGNEMITYYSLPDKPIKTITFRNGDTVEIRSYSQELTSIMGRVLDLIVLDEMPNDRMVISELVTRTFDCDGRIICGFTPLVENVEIKDYLDDKCVSGIMSLHSWSILSNPHYRDNPDRLARALAEWDSLPVAERNARLNGDWYFESKHGKIFADTNIDIVDPFEIPDFWRRARVVDPAAHKTGVSFYAEDPVTHTWYLYLSTTIGKLHQGIDAKSILHEIERIEPHKEYALSIYDNAELWFGSDPTTRDKFQPCILKNVNAGIMATKDAFNSGRVKIFSINKEGIQQLQQLEWGPEGKPKGKSKCHILDTILYFCRQVPPPCKKPKGPNKPKTDQEIAATQLRERIKNGIVPKDKPVLRQYGVNRKLGFRGRR